MSKIMYMGEEYCGVGIGGSGGSGTETPTANTTAAFDSSANMNSTDMSAQDVEDFVDSLNVDGHGWNSVYGTRSVYLPTVPSSEVIVRIRDANETLNFSFVLTKRMFELGGNYSSGGTATGDYCSLEVNKNGDNKLYVLSCYISGTNYQSGAIITAYYR